MRAALVFQRYRIFRKIEIEVRLPTDFFDLSCSLLSVALNY